MIRFLPFRTHSILFFAFFLLAQFFTEKSLAQFYNGSHLKFGKNRVQYRDFIWTYYMFDEYDVYFYRDGQKLAEFTSEYVEKELRKMERLLEASVDEKIQFIIFNSLTDLRQSNIGLVEDEEYNTGGITRILGRKVILYFNGDYGNFKKQIKAGLANVVINKLLYGGNIGSQIKNSTLFVLPDWYLNGLISYLSESWNTEIDNRVRDGILSGAYDKFNHLMNDDANYAGHSLWRYISEKYGRSSVPNILHMTNISNSIENGFLYVLGISFKTLIKEWLEYYREYYQPEENLSLPEKELIKKPKDNIFYNQLTTSPDGRYAAYVTNELGQYKIWILDLNTGKKKKILKAGYRIGENIDYSYPILCWHPFENILSYVVEKDGFVYFNLYNLDTKNTDTKLLVNFEKLLDYNYSKDGRKLVISALKQGRSDIFVFDIVSNSYQQITYDVYDDLEPSFMNYDNWIVFSSNRPDDTLRVVDEFPDKMDSNNDLFLYNYKTRENLLKRLTNTPVANETQALEYDEGYIAYLSDQSGIYNQYIGKFDSAISRIDTTVHYRYFMNAFPVTNYSRSILEQNINTEAMKQSKVIFDDEIYSLFIEDLPRVEDLAALNLPLTKYMKQQLKVRDEIESMQPHGGETEMPAPEQIKRRRFRVVTEDEEENKEDVDIDNYQFNRQAFVEIDGDEAVKTDMEPDEDFRKKKEDDFILPRRRYYRVEYFFNELTTQVDFTFLNATYQQFTGGGPIYLNPGFNALLKVGVSDLMEDYRMVGGVRLNVNLINNEYLFSYSNLKWRMDKQFVFHRQIIEGASEFSILRYYTNEMFYIMSWPFNEAMSLKGTFTFRNDAAVYLSTDQLNLQEPNRYQNWAGLKGEFTFDDTRNVGLNLYYGTRYKIFLEYYQLLDEDSRDLFVLGADYRRYIKIDRTFIWANRIAASTSFGKNKLIYYMGGVDNWLLPKFNNETPIDFSQNYRYQTLATNMRGFNQNIRNGNSFFLLNSELRFPVFKYFFNRPIKSDFLNNFQVVAFGDIGTAWTGLNPYSEDNSLFTRTIEDGPLTITVEEQKEPIVGGMGFGVRSRLLGYFLRADYAWGVEDRILKKPVFYISLSLDF